MIATLLVIHALVGIALFLAGDRLGQRAFVVAAVAPLALLAWLITRLGAIVDGEPVVESYVWVDGLGLSVDVVIDGFAAVMLFLVSGIGVLVCAYSVAYFGSKSGSGRLAALVCLFAGAMTGVVVSDHLLGLFVFWELTSITSYLLIGNADRNAVARAAALQALLITGAGGLAMLFGFVLVGQAAGTYRISEIVADPVTSGLASTVGIVCILVGAFSKSAQLPFGSWLPGAMVAPTPISAYLHSATMVKAGVFLIARLSPGFAALDLWTALVVTVGLATMVVGGLRALRQHDLKLLLAHGTTSQLGALVVLFGLGIPSVTRAAVVMLVAHAVFKAPLFMVVGIIDHQCGTRDVRRLAPPDRSWRWVVVVGVVSAMSMAGLPPLLGFIGKEFALDALLDERGAARWALVGFVIGSVLTVAYSARFVLGITGRLADHDAVERSHGDAPTPAFLAPAALLAGASVLTGLVPGVIDPLMGAAAEALGAPAKHVALWHGVNAALVTSLVVIGLGLAVARADRQVQPLLARGSVVPSSDAGYRRLLTGVTAFARRVTAVVQHGSLPVYASVIMLTISVVPTVALVMSGALPGLPDVVDAPIEIPLVGLALSAALGAALVRRRFAAALVLGAVGYAMAGVYVVMGATDLALTQFAIETLSVVVFMLALRSLPDRETAPTPILLQVVRLVVSVTVAAFVALFAITAPTLRTQRPVSDEMIARAGPEAKGQNVVNVIIVDFRGLDTVGELGVLMVAVLGAVGLVRSDRLGRARPSAPAEVGA